MHPANPVILSNVFAFFSLCFNLYPENPVNPVKGEDPKEIPKALNPVNIFHVWGWAGCGILS